MTLTLELAPETVEALTEAAVRQGQTRESLAAAALQRLFNPREDIATLLVGDEQDDEGAALVAQAFQVAAEGTRHVWDTPEEDKAWAHL